MLIGVTGQIGSGKSFFVTELKKLGAKVIDADKIGKQISGSPESLQSLRKKFGESVVTRSGKLRKKQLAQIVFSDKTGKSVQFLNRLTHPKIGRELREKAKAIFQKDPNAVVVIDAALLPEWPIAKKLDLIVNVQARREIRLIRLQSKGMTERQARDRMRSQRSAAEYRRIADVLIANDGSLAELSAKAVRFWERHIAPRLISQ